MLSLSTSTRTYTYIYDYVYGQDISSSERREEERGKKRDENERSSFLSLLLDMTKVLMVKERLFRWLQVSLFIFSSSRFHQSLRLMIPWNISPLIPAKRPHLYAIYQNDIRVKLSVDLAQSASKMKDLCVFCSDWILWTDGTFIRSESRRKWWSKSFSCRTNVSVKKKRKKCVWFPCLLVSYAWTWSLTISDVADDDGGEYTCRISSDDRTLTIIKRFDLTVLSKQICYSCVWCRSGGGVEKHNRILSLSLSGCYSFSFDRTISMHFFFVLAPPKIVEITIESTHPGVLLENEQVILRCLTRGNPPPNILWIYSNRNTSTHRNIISFHNQLLIQNFSRLSPTNYQCIADNGIPPRDTRSRRLIPASKLIDAFSDAFWHTHTQKKRMTQLTGTRKFLSDSSVC